MYGDVQTMIESIDKQLGYFVDNLKEDQLSLPLMSNTYTLWRRWAYHTLPPPISPTTTLQFYVVSECRHLRHFIQRTKDKWSNECTIPNSFPPQFYTLYKEYSDLFAQYSFSLWRLRLMNELLIDMIRLPYLHDVFPPDNNYIMCHQYYWKVYLKDDDSIGQKIVEKGLGKGLNTGVTKAIESIGAKAIFMPLLGAINPFALGASIGVAQGVKYYEKKQLTKKLHNHLTTAIQLCEERTNALEAGLQQVISLIGEHLQCRVEGDSLKCKQAEDALKKRMERYVQKDWFKIKVQKDNQGWDIITLEDDNDFQVMRSEQEGRV